MDIIRKMRSHYHEMTVSERKVYDTIIADPSLVHRFTISQIAMMSDTSTSAVMRFCRRLGCSGYKEFHYEVLDSLRGQEEKKTAGKDLAAVLADEYASAVSSLKNLDRELLEAFGDDILSADKVILLGRYRNKSLTLKLAMGLTDLGIVCLIGSDLLEYMHLVDMITPNTCVIMFTSLGEIRDMKEFLQIFPGKSCRSWLITTAPNAKIIPYMKHAIRLPAPPPGFNSLASFHPVMMIFCEILTAYVGEKQTMNICHNKSKTSK